MNPHTRVTVEMLEPFWTVTIGQDYRGRYELRLYVPPSQTMRQLRDNLWNAERVTRKLPRPKDCPEDLLEAKPQGLYYGAIFTPTQELVDVVNEYRAKKKLRPVKVVVPDETSNLEKV